MVAIIDLEYTPAEISEEDKKSEDTVDPNVSALLPAGCTVNLVTTIEASFWAVRKKIATSHADGRLHHYFLKIYSGDLGRRMAVAEFEGSTASYSVIPANTARPIGRDDVQGTYADQPNKHFLLLQYHKLDITELPRPSDIAGTLASLHRNSVSPTGRFGFHAETFGGCQSIDTAWTESWETFFTRLFRNAVETEAEIHGHDDELSALTGIMISHAIPRLLRPMETDGRKIWPCLLHGDLWHGNIGVDTATGNTFVFDFASVYGHNEYDMAPWRAARYKTGVLHRAAYHAIIEPSPPEEDADDRNALYAVKRLNDLLVSANWPKTKKTRSLAMEGMRNLVTKFPDGYEGYVEARRQLGIHKPGGAELEVQACFEAEANAVQGEEKRVVALSGHARPGQSLTKGGRCKATFKRVFKTKTVRAIWFKVTGLFTSVSPK